MDDCDRKQEENKSDFANEKKKKMKVRAHTWRRDQFFFFCVIKVFALLMQTRILHTGISGQ